jgi:hypothetical protein
MRMGIEKNPEMICPHLQSIDTLTSTWMWIFMALYTTPSWIYVNCFYITYNTLQSATWTWIFMTLYTTPSWIYVDCFYITYNTLQSATWTWIFMTLYTTPSWIYVDCFYITYNRVIVALSKRELRFINFTYLVFMLQ